MLLLLFAACSLENGLLGLFDGKDDTAADSGGKPPTSVEDWQACGEAVPAPAATVGTDTCAGMGGTVADPWAIDVLWSHGGTPEQPETCAMTPLVAQLDDDNGDGVVDDDDEPEVLSNFTNYQRLVFDGRTGAVEEILSNYRDVDTFVVADLDGDAHPEIVAIEGPKHTLQAFRVPGGERLWDSGVYCSHHYLDVSDLEDDGTPEILCETAVFDGRTGALRWGVAVAADIGWTQSMAADLDLDGTREVFMMGGLYDADGSARWRVQHDGLGGGWPLWVQADDDPEGEVVWVGAAVDVYDTDGTLLTSTPNPLDNHGRGPACAGDFDGDGDTEVASPSGTKLTAFDLDGGQLWQAPLDDLSSNAGCAAFDFDGDGAMEVVFGGQSALRIHDGRTGATLLEDPRHESYTNLETPSVADVEGDGDAELLVCANSGGDWGGLAVLTHAGAGWAHTGSTWHTPPFVGEELDPGAQIPAPAAIWEPGLLRARPSWVPGDGTAELFVIATDLCVDCPGDASVAVQVGNQGGVDAAAVELRVYDVASGRLLSAMTVGPLPAGVLLPGVVLDLDLAQVGPDGIELRLDEAGTVPDCEPADNRLVLPSPGC